MFSLKMANIYPKQAGVGSLRNNATHLLSTAISWQQPSNYMWIAGSTLHVTLSSAVEINSRHKTRIPSQVRLLVHGFI
jgi:hypothetical protein